MEAIAEKRGQFRRIGNSIGVIVPAALREIAGFDECDEVLMQCPRRGVITISCIEGVKEDKLKEWNDLQSFISCNKNKEFKWPKDKSFKQILNESRDERFKA